MNPDCHFQLLGIVGPPITHIQTLSNKIVSVYKLPTLPLFYPYWFSKTQNTIRSSTLWKTIIYATGFTKRWCCQLCESCMESTSHLIWRNCVSSYCSVWYWTETYGNLLEFIGPYLMFVENIQIMFYFNLFLFHFKFYSHLLFFPLAFIFFL